VQEHGGKYRYPGNLWVGPKLRRYQSPGVDKVVYARGVDAQLVEESGRVRKNDQPIDQRKPTGPDRIANWDHITFRESF
jgi:hypothetical protein